nr:permease [Borreliella mayonii]
MIVSGDQFIDLKYMNKIIKNFKDVIVFEMEGVVIGHVAHTFNVHFIVIGPYGYFK